MAEQAEPQKRRPMRRGVLDYAKQQGWIIRNPFEFGAPLISKAQGRVVAIALV